MKLADVLPAETVTVAGSVAAGLPLDRVTTAPPVGAWAFSVTVPVELVPPVTLFGFRVTEASVAADGTTVIVVAWVDPYVPWIVTGVALATDVVVTLNVALDPPALTFTLAGTCATEALPLDSVTTAPPVGAGPLNVTVPVEPTPPTTLVGFTVTALKTTAGGPPP